jgi:DNA invertase Pin-like site-specific DNA recombinase
MLQQMAAVAELEAGMISARTKAALKAAKARGAPRHLGRGGCTQATGSLSKYFTAISAEPKAKAQLPGAITPAISKS